MSHEKLGCSIKGEGPYLKRKLFSVNTFVGVHSCGSSISSGISFIEVLIKRDHLPDLVVQVTEITEIFELVLIHDD